MEDQAQLMELTADIVAAHVSNNKVAVGDMSSLIGRVYESLSGLGAPAAEPEDTRRKPRVTPRAAIKPDSITCLVCGMKQKMLKRHLQNAHQMTPGDYRQEFDLRPDYPMVAPNYSEQRRGLAKAHGLGTKGRKGGGARGKTG